MIRPLPVRRSDGQGLVWLAAVVVGLGIIPGLAGAAEPGARQRTVIETMVAASNPCASLRTEVGGQAIGLDELDDVEIRTADASLAGDAVTLTLAGRLSCRTPAGALLKGDAASDVTATAAVSLTDCTAADVRVSLSDFGGSFGMILQALQPTIEAKLVEAARPQVVATCRAIRSDLGGG